MKLTLSRLIITSGNGKSQLHQQLGRLYSEHDRVDYSSLSSTELDVGDYGVKAHACRIVINLVPKPSMTEEQAVRWFAHKTESWLNGYAVFEIGDVTCVRA